MERWEQVKEFPMYEVSTKGRIRNIKTGRILHTYLNPNGYKVVTLTRKGKQKTVKVHRLVAEVFCEKYYDDTEVTYIDGDKTNLDVKNLDWLKKSDINRRAYRRNGRDRRPGRKMRAIRVKETGEIFESITEASENLGLNISTISKCLNYPYYKNRCGYHFEEIEWW